MSESRNLSSQSQAMMSLNLQLRSTVMKSQAKAIDLDLRKLDAAQATERLNYVQVRSSKWPFAVATTPDITFFHRHIFQILSSRLRTTQFHVSSCLDDCHSNPS